MLIVVIWEEESSCALKSISRVLTIRSKEQEEHICSLVGDELSVPSGVAPILYQLSIYRLYRPKILVSAIGNITKCILVTKILHFYGKIGHKIVNYLLKVENLNKVVYRISYRYRQIFLIHYWLSEYRLNSISVHH